MAVTLSLSMPSQTNGYSENLISADRSNNFASMWCLRTVIGSTQRTIDLNNIIISRSLIQSFEGLINHLFRDKFC